MSLKVLKVEGLLPSSQQHSNVVGALKESGAELDKVGHRESIFAGARASFFFLAALSEQPPLPAALIYCSGPKVTGQTLV